MDSQRDLNTEESKNSESKPRLPESKNFIVWSDNSQIFEGQKISQFASNVCNFIPEYEGKTKNLYFWGDCMIFLTVEDKVYRKGSFPFEKKLPENLKKSGNKSEKKRLKETTEFLFEPQVKVKKMSFGLNHALFLTDLNELFTLGDNTFGQIGLGPDKLEANKPVRIREQKSILSENNKVILAYKNTSFFISDKKGLFAFGDGTYAGNYRGNIYFPKHIHQDVLVNKIFQKDGRLIIISFPLNQETKQKLQGEEVDKIFENKKENEIDRSNPNIIRRKSSIISVGKSLNSQGINDYKIDLRKVFEKLAPISYPLLRVLRLSHQLKDLSQDQLIKMGEDISEESKDNKKTIKYLTDKLLEKYNEEYIKHQETFIVKDEKHEKMKGIKAILESFDNYNDYKENNDEILLKEKKESVFWFFAKGDQNEENERDFTYIDYLEKYLEANPQDNNNKVNYYEKGKINEKNMVVKFYNKYFPYSVKFKKVESLVYRLSLHNLILNTYEVNNLLGGFEYVFSSTSRDTYKKDLLINKGIMVNDQLIDEFEDNFTGLQELYKKLPQCPKILMNNSGNKKESEQKESEQKGSEQKESEQYIYKNLIESVVLFKDLLKKSIEELEKENEARKQVDYLKYCITRLTEIRALQLNLEKINPQPDSKDKEKNKETPDSKDKEKNKGKNKFIEDAIKDIDGILNRLLVIKHRIIQEEYKKISAEAKKISKNQKDRENKIKERNKKKGIAINENNKENRINNSSTVSQSLINKEGENQGAKFLEDILSMYISCLIETAFYKKTLYYLFKYVEEQNSQEKEKREEKKKETKDKD